MSSIEHVSDTAFLVAHHRATESTRPDALFRDPFAERLAGDRGRAIAQASPAAAMSGWMIAIRTVVIDELIRSAVADGVDMVVNVGAGLDTRPYRLDLPPELAWIEIDFPDVIELKLQQLGSEAPRCQLERIALDLSVAEARRAQLAALDGRARRMLVLTEGVVPYLDLDQAGALARDLRALSHVEGWIVDYVSPQSHAYRRRAGVDKHFRNAPFKFRPADWFGFFAERGWRARDVRYLPIEARRLGRRPPFPRRMRFVMALMRALLGRRADGFRKAMGYVLLVPDSVGRTS